MRTELEISTALDKLPLCGCGSSQAMRLFIQRILERAEAKGLAKRPSFYDSMTDADLGGEIPPLAVEFAAQVLTSEGFLEHGTSVGFSWLTRAGAIVLRFLQKYGVDDDEWPEYAAGPSEEPWELEPADWRKLTMGGDGDISANDIP